MARSRSARPRRWSAPLASIGRWRQARHAQGSEHDMGVSASPIRRLTTTVNVVGRSFALERRVVWMLGSPRSGSTWLLHLLARLTGASAVDEPLIGAHLATPLGAVSGLPS